MFQHLAYFCWASLTKLNAAETALSILVKQYFVIYCTAGFSEATENME